MRVEKQRAVWHELTSPHTKNDKCDTAAFINVCFLALPWALRISRWDIRSNSSLINHCLPMLAISDLVCWSWHMPVIYVGSLTACILLAVTVVPELFLLLVWYPAPEMLRQKQRTMGLKAAWATQWVWDKPELRRESLSPGYSHVRVLDVCCLVRRLWSKKKTTGLGGTE